MPSIHFNHGIEKPRGLENAELQHLKHLSKADQAVSVQPVEPITDHNSSFDPYLVATVELGNGQPVSQTTYSPPSAPFPTESSANNGDDILLIGNGVKLNLNSRVEVDNANDIMIIGNGAKVNWNSTVGVDNGNDTVIIGNGAKVEYNGITGVDNGNDTLIIGNVSVDRSNGGITYLDGKVHIHLVDESNQSFKLELKVKDKEEAASFLEFLRDKVKDKKLGFADFINTVREAQEHVKETKVKDKKNIEPALLNRQDEPKTINKHQFRLETLQSLVQNLLQYQFHANQGLHTGFNRNVDRKI